MVELKESIRVCSSEVQKAGGGGKGERESNKVCSSEKGGGLAGGRSPPPLCKPSLNDFVFFAFTP